MRTNPDTAENNPLKYSALLLPFYFNFFHVLNPNAAWLAH